MSYLDDTGLAYFWTKIKAYVSNFLTWANIQNKPSTFTPSVHSHGNITNAGELGTASRAVVTDGNKKVSVSSVTSTELGYLSGVTSNVQTQLNGKANASAIPTIPNLSRTISGSGNAITDITVSGHAITATKGTTFLTSHQNLDNYVTLDDAQTIYAVKTFTTEPLIRKGAPAFILKNTSVETTVYPSSGQQDTRINFQDKNGHQLCSVLHRIQTNRSAMYLRVFNFNRTDSDNAWSDIAIGYDNSGNVYTAAPTPATADNSTKIATTAFVKAQGYITSSSNITGTAANVTGTVAIANGGTGATTRLDAVKALTNEKVSTSATCFLTITDSWGKAGYTTVADAKTVLGLKSAAYTESSAYATSGHTHSYLPLSGGTLTGTLTGTAFIYKSTNIDRTDTTTNSSTENWVYAYKDKNNYDIGNYGISRHPKNGQNRHRFRLHNTGNSWADLVFEFKDNGQYSLFMTGASGTTNAGFTGNITGNAATVSGTAGTSLLAWNTENTVYTVGGHAIKVKLPANPNTDTHWTSHLYAGASDGKTNAATTNGNTYLIICDNNTARDRRLIKGTGATTVTSDSSGNITIHSTDNNTTYSANNGVGLSGTTFYNSGVRSIATGSTSGTISVNTNGTAADVKVKGLGTAAYTASTAYAAASHSHSNYVTHDTDQTITGVKTFRDVIIDSTHSIRKASNDSVLYLAGGTGIANGAQLSLCGKDYSDNKGLFALWAKDGTTSKSFRGLPGGTLTWNGQNIQVSSDERIKTQLHSIPDNVLNAWGDVDWGQFQYLEAVAEKGETARLHLGLIAQRVISVFERHSLDACNYGILCHEEHEATEDADAVDLWMVRYAEALCMEAAYQRRENARLKKLVADLEERLAALELKIS